MPDTLEPSSVEALWYQAVESVKGAPAVKSALAKLTQPAQPLRVLAIGKAASSMLQGVIDAGWSIERALVLTKYAHCLEALNQPHIEQFESAHPVPDENSLLAGQKAQQFVADSRDSALLVLVSGGGSALVEVLPANMALTELSDKTQALLAEGADIGQINQYRRQISEIKGGKLLSHAPCTWLTSLMISDVEGDDPNTIASGIGVCPNQHIIASNQIARQCIAAQTSVVLNQEALYGDVVAVAKTLAATLKSGPSGLYVFGGEPTVQLPHNPGEGGRNQALAVQLAIELADEDVFGLVAGTDGSDGPTGSAGGWLGLTPVDVPAATAALAEANAGQYLRQSQQLFVSGPTGTNVMDLALIVKR